MRYRASLVVAAMAVAIALLALAISIAKLAVIMYQVSIVDFEPSTLTMRVGETGRMVVSCLVTDNNRIGCVAEVVSGSITMGTTSVITSTTVYTISMNLTLVFVPHLPGTYTAIAMAFDPLATYNAASLTLPLYVEPLATSSATSPSTTTSFSPTTTSASSPSPRETGATMAAALAIALLALLALARRGEVARY